MISEEEALRAEAWVQEAATQGASILTGGNRKGVWFEPTILVNVKSDRKVVCQEAFAPIVSIVPYDTIVKAIAMVNDSKCGLQAGVFTKFLDIAGCVP